MTITTIQANVIYRVLARIHELAQNAIALGGRENIRDGMDMARLAGALEERCLPYAHYHEDNPLSEPRCTECHHFEDEHENGRCTHFSTTGYQRDTVCSCTGFARAAA
jgi:hypothetical protein